MKNTMRYAPYRVILILVCFFIAMGAVNVNTSMYVANKAYQAKALASYNRPEGIFVSAREFIDIDNSVLQKMEFQFHFCPINERVFEAVSKWSRSPSFFHKRARAGIWYKIKIAYQIIEDGYVKELGFLDLGTELRGFRPKTVGEGAKRKVILPQAYNPLKKKLYNEYLRSYLEQPEILESDKCYGLSFLSQSASADPVFNVQKQEADLTEVTLENKEVPGIFSLLEATVELFQKGQEIYRNWSPKWSVRDPKASSEYYYQKYKKLILLTKVEVRDIPLGFQNTGAPMYVPGIKLNIEQDQSSSVLSNQYATLDKFINTQGIHIWQEIPCSDTIDTDLILETQSALKALGYYQEIENGVFDSYTKLAITKFQLERGLPIGNLDLVTLAYLGIKY